MRDWRPVGWNGLKAEDYLNIKDDNGVAVTLYIPPGRAHRESEIYEAGADAILDAMWKLAEESPTKTFTIDANCNQVYSQKPPDGCNSEES